jgi:hypothetical protein
VWFLWPCVCSRLVEIAPPQSLIYSVQNAHSVPTLKLRTCAVLSVQKYLGWFLLGFEAKIERSGNIVRGPNTACQAKMTLPSFKVQERKISFKGLHVPADLFPAKRCG